MSEVLRAVVDVLVDGAGRLGSLSYLVPGGLELHPGDAVTVPFGRQERHGLVLGPSRHPEKASREIIVRHGQRVDPVDMGLAFELAQKHFASLPQVAARLSPSSGRNSAPVDAGPVVLVPRPADPQLPVPPRNWANRLYLRPPLLDPARLAALEAFRLAGGGGQVLVLAPTVRLLERVLDEFSSGAARLDSKARAGAWNGWRDGSVRVGVGTRAAAFYSAARLSGVVVVEEEHPGHVESSLPYTNARDVGRRRAALHRCPCTLISASPSAAGMHGSKVLPLPESRRHWPQVTVVSRKANHPQERTVPPRVRYLVENAKLPVVMLAENRPSRRTCARCGDSRPCPDCTETCDHREVVPCPRCQSLGVRLVGWDKARLGKTFPTAQALTLPELPGLDSADRLVVVLSTDALLSAPALDSLHASSSVLLRVAEVAGRGGRLVLVSDLDEHPVVRAFRSRDTFALAREVWEAARAAQLPPFGHLVTVRVGREAPPRTVRWPGQVLGPRRRGKEWEVLVRVSAKDLPELRRHLDALRARGKTRIRIE